MARIFLLIFIVLFSATSYQVSGQQPANSTPNQTENSEDPALRITTELLQIDAVVTDKKGRVIDNLTQDDFELLDNGKPQKIELFKIIRTNPTNQPPPLSSLGRSKPDANTAAEPIESEGRVFIILLDDLHIRTANIQLVKQQLREFIDDRFRENDRVAIITVSGSLGFLQQLTNDRRVNRRAIEAIQSQTQLVATGLDPARLTEIQAQRILQNDTAALNLAIDTYLANTAGAVTNRDSIVREITSISRMIVDQLAKQTTATLSSLRNTMKLLKTIPGRKSLMLISDGFLTEARDGNNLNELTRVTSEATRAGVVVYSLSSNNLTSLPSVPGQDITSGRPPNITSIQLAGQENVLRYSAMGTIATETGGFGLNNLTDLRTSFAKVVNDSEVYYLFGYYPQESAKGNKFHEVKLRLKNDDNRKIRSRRGYYEISKDEEEKLAQKEQEKLAQQEKKDKKEKEKKDKDKAKENSTENVISTQLSSALSAFVPINDINVKASGSFVATANNQDNALLSLAINLANIQFNQSNNSYHNLVETALVVFAEDGKIVHSTESKLELNFNEKNYQRNGRGWFFFGNTLSLKPGLYNIRFAVRDPISQALGSISEFIEVPDLSKQQLALSSILVFNEAPPQSDKLTEKKGTQSTLNGSAQALRFFSRKGFLGFISYIYNLPSATRSENLISEIRVMRNNELVATALRPVEINPDKYNRIPISSTIPLKDFQPGRYQLRIEVMEKQSGKRSSQSIDFVIGG